MSTPPFTLFLDIDGVLNSDPFLRDQKNHEPEDNRRLTDPANLRALERLCDEVPIGAIVLSSSWRRERSLAELRVLFAQEGFAAFGRIDDVTGDDPDTSEGRAAAIQAYVEQHELQRYLVLDDYALPPMRDGIVVQCSPHRGLTIEDVPRIVAQCHALPHLPTATRQERALVDAFLRFVERGDPGDPDDEHLLTLYGALDNHLYHAWPGTKREACFDGAIRYEIQRRTACGLTIKGAVWELDGAAEPVPFELTLEVDPNAHRITAIQVTLAAASG